MRPVVELLQHISAEPVRFDPDRLHRLFRQLGERSAEAMLSRALEELAVRLSLCEDHWHAESWPDLQKCARSIIAISEQIGLTTLARVAGDVTGATARRDLAAVGATLARLVRIGERSLTAVWDLRDLSV
ncbi:hypothetical protein [Albibacillus kandeliae]|uniref:hypothetical protein n=1 Tax=Albibacillus kandeliae TaxID=2174228 RepID=UPI001E4F2F5F|nr:hypothetical protein [Albibacillus kandeliae]